MRPRIMPVIAYCWILNALCYVLNISKFTMEMGTLPARRFQRLSKRLCFLSSFLVVLTPAHLHPTLTKV